ncbi:hypothetical protein [Ottowia thiooxydans]|uniref:Uncharacterized protein n=1 Tax=Ottowia thiooxydans TaxID=219182 RepID=A0ABV2QHJ1_9BURK
MVVTAMSLVGFIIAERTHTHPMFDFSVFSIRDFTGAILGCVGMNFSYWPFTIYLPLYFTAGFGMDVTSAGLVLLAGLGLGLTTTPATSMTTSAVPSHRADMGHAVDVKPTGFIRFGSGQFVYKLPTGYLAASDSRRDGQAVGF